MEFFSKTVDFYICFVYNTKSHFGVWRSLVSRLVRDQEAMGSSPVTPTKSSSRKGLELLLFHYSLFLLTNKSKSLINTRNILKFLDLS